MRRCSRGVRLSGSIARKGSVDEEVAVLRVERERAARLRHMLDIQPANDLGDLFHRGLIIKGEMKILDSAFKVLFSAIDHGFPEMGGGTVGILYQRLIEQIHRLIHIASREMTKRTMRDILRPQRRLITSHILHKPSLFHGQRRTQ